MNAIGGFLEFSLEYISFGAAAGVAAISCNSFESVVVLDVAAIAFACFCCYCCCFYSLVFVYFLFIQCFTFDCWQNIFLAKCTDVLRLVLQPESTIVAKPSLEQQQNETKKKHFVCMM